MYVTAGSFKERRFVNIRVWSTEGPTKNGITLNSFEYTVLLPFLEESDEIGVFKLAYKQLMLDRALDLLKQNCEGCEIDAPSQLDHACITTPHSQAINALVAKNKWRLCPFDVIVKAAEIGRERRVFIQRPLEIMDVLVTALREELLDFCADYPDEQF